MNAAFRLLDSNIFESIQNTFTGQLDDFVIGLADAEIGKSIRIVSISCIKSRKWHNKSIFHKLYPHKGTEIGIMDMLAFCGAFYEEQP